MTAPEPRRCAAPDCERILVDAHALKRYCSARCNARDWARKKAGSQPSRAKANGEKPARTPKAPEKRVAAIAAEMRDLDMAVAVLRQTRDHHREKAAACDAALAALGAS